MRVWKVRYAIPLSTEEQITTVEADSMAIVESGAAFSLKMEGVMETSSAKPLRLVIGLLMN